MSLVVPSLNRRIHTDEWMDDHAADEAELGRALRELLYVNSFLGGYRALRRYLIPYLRVRRGELVKVLDLGTGLADYPARMVQWGADLDVDVRVTAVDFSPSALHHARAHVEARLPPELRGRVRLERADATRLTYPDGAFHIATCSHFLHHFDDEGAIALLRDVARIASDGLIINDLHRHPLAYSGIRAIAAVFPVSSMFSNDGPLSVRRSFRPSELRRLAADAGLTHAVVARHWAFRLALATV